MVGATMGSQSNRVSAACWILIAAACSLVDEPLTTSQVIGLYQLESVGGHPLPVDLPPGEPHITLSADSLWLRADGAFEEHMMRAAIGPASLLVIAGQFQLVGSTIQLTETGGTPVIGTFLGSRLTVRTSSADASVYQRRCSGAAC
jgi:hypothetical protein